MPTTRKVGGSSTGQIDWKSERDRIDLARVATNLLGPAPGRARERGRRLWWNCPFHEDKNPSFFVDPGKPFWRCYGCGEHGDAATLLMRLEDLTFPMAVARLVGSRIPQSSAARRPTPPSRPESEPKEARGLPSADALALVVEAEARLWSPEGVEALAYLTDVRKLTHETIRAARLGWTPRASIPTKDGDRWYPVRGVVIPWFDGDRLALAKVRQPDGSKPKYAAAFWDRPSHYPGPHAIEVGRPLVIAEGEFDALLLGQELASLAPVVTLGSASGRIDAEILAALLPASPWFVATDADAAGERAAGKWPARARRVRPPGTFNDWTEACQAGVHLRRWWSDRIGGNESPPLFTWDELSRQRWGEAVGDPTPGIVMDGRA